VAVWPTRTLNADLSDTVRKRVLSSYLFEKNRDPRKRQIGRKLAGAHGRIGVDIVKNLFVGAKYIVKLEGGKSWRARYSSARKR
jgi:hypothetical protein